MERTGLFIGASICRVGVGLSKTRTGDFLRLARKLVELPKLKIEMEEGRVGFSKAVEVIKVAGSANEEFWVKEAITQNRNELRKKVSRAQKKAKTLHKSYPDQSELLALPQSEEPAAITPKTRRRVLSRDHHRCRAKGCSHTAFLQIHHIIPRNKGGMNNQENLITLCGSCHRRIHDKGHLVNVILPVCTSEPVSNR